jgi:hypothetical protein
VRGFREHAYKPPALEGSLDTSNRMPHRGSGLCRDTASVRPTAAKKPVLPRRYPAPSHTDQIRPNRPRLIGLVPTGKQTVPQL